jgi:hypothetical protein
MVLAAIGSFAQKVHVKFDRGVDFSKFKTYAWLESKHPADGLWDQRVMAAIDRQLTRKGLTRVDGSTSPDLQVVYNAGVKERTIVQGYDYGYVYTEYLYRRLYGPLWFWPVGPGSWVSEVEKNGSLVVDLVDASREDMVWRGVAKDTLSDKSEKNEQKLDKGSRRCSRNIRQKKCMKIK